MAKKKVSKSATKKATKKVPRSAASGRFVKKSELKSKPKETYADTVPVKKRK